MKHGIVEFISKHSLIFKGLGLNRRVGTVKTKEPAGRLTADAGRAFRQVVIIFAEATIDQPERRQEPQLRPCYPRRVVERRTEQKIDPLDQLARECFLCGPWLPLHGFNLHF